MKGKMVLYIGQYGGRYWARPVRELRSRVGGGWVSKMCRGKKDGRTVHVGYVVGRHWCEAFLPIGL